jgi:hypothetical protein
MCNDYPIFSARRAPGCIKLMLSLKLSELARIRRVFILGTSK